MIPDSTKSNEIALQEAHRLKVFVQEFVNREVFKNPALKIHVRDNRNSICDLRSNGFTLLIQMCPEEYDNPQPYLKLVIVKGYFDVSGKVESFDKIEVQEEIRLDLFSNPQGELSWRNRIKQNEFHLPKKITELWLKKFLNIVNH